MKLTHTVISEKFVGSENKYDCYLACSSGYIKSNGLYYTSFESSFLWESSNI